MHIYFHIQYSKFEKKILTFNVLFKKIIITEALNIKQQVASCIYKMHFVFGTNKNFSFKTEK